MAVIGFSYQPEEIWCASGWIFHQVLDDVGFYYPEDLEMADEFDGARARSGLGLDLVQSELAVRIATAIWQVAGGILSGEIRSGLEDRPYADAELLGQYREALQELLGAFPAAWREADHPQ
ncbi:MAG TPA: hypothetical protein VJ302_27575 [Blastocatellia bacterium]|nr:hypothetical protein [Blastocatellia bacterium]